MKMKLYSILLVGLVLLLATLLVGCGYDHLDKAEDYLKEASKVTSKLRMRAESGEPVQHMASQLEYIEDLIDDALQELYDMRPNY